MKKGKFNKGSKKVAVRKHATRRLGERFPSIPKEQLDIWVSEIQESKHAPIERQSNNIRVYAVEYAGEGVHVVYNKKMKSVVTVLFPDPKEDPLGFLYEK